MIFRIPPTSSRLHPGFTQPHFSLTNPLYLLPTDKWARLPLGGKGPKRREQDDESVDQIRAGRGLDTGGELLGRQRAGGGDAPWPGWRLAGAANRPGCASPDGCPFPASGRIAIGCCRAQHFRTWIAAFNPDHGGDCAAYCLSTQAGWCAAQWVSRQSGWATAPDIGHPTRRWPLEGR
ncbi:hypothetical protein D3C77_233330 [compost metagenome]